MNSEAFTIILTSVSVELMSFNDKTNKLTDADVNQLTRDIVERIDRVLKKHGHKILKEETAKDLPDECTCNSNEELKKYYCPVHSS